MTGRNTVEPLAWIAAVLSLAGGLTALWAGVAAASADLSRSTGGRGLGWVAGMLLAAAVATVAAAVTGRRLSRLLAGD